MRLLGKLIFIALLTAIAAAAEIFIFGFGQGKMHCNFGSGYTYGCSVANYQFIIVIALIYIGLVAYVLRNR